MLASRTPAERAQVMALGSQLQVLTQPISGCRRVARRRRKHRSPAIRARSFGELARALRSLAESVHTPIELHLFSDMQKSDMPANFSELALPANVTLVLHPVAKDAVPNWTVESVNAPGQVWDPKKARVQAVIAGYHTPAATRTVSLVVNGKTIATQSVEVPANGRATVEFQSLDVPYGFSRCEVRIDSADALPADDASLFAVERSDPRQVLFVHESSDTRSPLYFGAALAAAAESRSRWKRVTVEQAASMRALEICLRRSFRRCSRCPLRSKTILSRYVRGGGSVLIAAGTSAAHRPRIPVFGANILRSALLLARRRRLSRPWATPIPRIRPSAKADHWAGVKFYYAVRVDDSGDARVVARLTDQTPLLLEKKSAKAACCCSPRASTISPTIFRCIRMFVPFVEQTARYLSGTERRSGSRLVDSFLELRTAKEQAVSVEVIDPDGRRPLSLKEAATAQSYQLTHAGFYQLRLANGRQDVIGVNPDRRESDLDVIPADVLSLWSGNAGTQPEHAGRGRRASPRKSTRLQFVVVRYAICIRRGDCRILACEPLPGHPEGGPMSTREQLNSYIEQVGATPAPRRHAARRRDPHLCRAGRHRRPRPDHQRLCVFRVERRQRARHPFARAGLAAAFGIAFPSGG